MDNLMLACSRHHNLVHQKGWTVKRLHNGEVHVTARSDDGAKTFAYSGDTEWTDALLPIAKDADLFICECYAYAGTITGHLTWETLKPRLADLEARQITQVLAPGERDRYGCGSLYSAQRLPGSNPTPSPRPRTPTGRPP